MPNAYFEFKQFTVYQDRCAMKVCTDSCILGAYADVSDAARILDIGTGTGLLALMLAQRSTATIDAVEIDHNASSQARENVADSPWADRITVHHQPIQAFAVRASREYDLIICNPPFYTNNFKRPHPQQNVAMHSESLQLPELAILVSHLLTENGKFVLLLPPYECQVFTEAAAPAQLHPTHHLRVFDRVGGKCIRVVSTYSFAKVAPGEELLYVQNAEGKYSAEFRELLRPYYLHF